MCFERGGCIPVSYKKRFKKWLRGVEIYRSRVYIGFVCFMRRDEVIAQRITILMRICKQNRKDSER